jgi:N-acetylglutamate synthase-like GNAT family acetyltransferase
MQARTREVKALVVDEAERGKGYGTTLMHKLAREADADNLVLVLMIDDEALAGWYEQFGFALIQKEPALLMARPPGSTPRLLELNPVARVMALARIGGCA